MKHLAARILLFILLGAVINVAVAWGCALWAPHHPIQSPKSSMGGSVPSDLEPIMPQAWQRPPSTDVVCLFSNDREEKCVGSYARRCELQWIIGGGIPILMPDRVLHIQRCGWPLSALQCTGELTHVQSTSGQHTYESVWHGGLSTPGLLSSRRFTIGGWFGSHSYTALPVAPLWWGFLADTALYSGAAWIVASGPPALRRTALIRRNLCPHCAYPVGTSPVCTECGKPVKPRPAPPAFNL